jgi:hypothetical protein
MLMMLVEVLESVARPEKGEINEQGGPNTKERGE